MAIVLPPLPYAKDALEPYITAQTIDFHYGKHHQTYVDNINKMVVGTPFEGATLEEIIKKAEGGIFNNGAQVWNHTFYWNQFKPKADAEPTGKLADAIKASFGSFAEFKEKFAASAVTLFGAGWAWLSKDASGKLSITQESNAGNPMRHGLFPILTFDVWEHAYYLMNQNRRAEHVGNIWNIINWTEVETRYTQG